MRYCALADTHNWADGTPGLVAVLQEAATFSAPEGAPACLLPTSKAALE